MSKLYLGFDAGTQSVKVSVYDENLKSITSQSLPTILRYPHAGWVEMDLDEFLDITVRCIKRCVDDIKALGYDPKDVRAVKATRSRPILITSIPVRMMTFVSSTT